MATDGHAAAADGAAASRPAWGGPRAAGAFVALLGLLALVQTVGISSARDGWALEGPRPGPLIVSVVLIVLGVAILARTVWRPDTALADHAAAEHAAAETARPAALVALLVGYALVLSALGYALATTAFVWLTAWLLGSEKPVRDGVVALVLGVVVSVAFSRLLGVRLPEGPWGI